MQPTLLGKTIMVCYLVHNKYVFYWPCIYFSQFQYHTLCVVVLGKLFCTPNREYLAPQIRSMNNRFHIEAKLPWSYDYPLANHIATNKSSANREVPLFSRLCPSFGCLRKIFPPRGLKYSLLWCVDVYSVKRNCVLFVTKLLLSILHAS